MCDQDLGVVHGVMLPEQTLVVVQIINITLLTLSLHPATGNSKTTTDVIIGKIMMCLVAQKMNMKDMKTSTDCGTLLKSSESF